MFTGIIEELGIVTSLIRRSPSGKITISASRAFADTKVGESVALNGVCLTVTSLRRNFLEFDLSAETLKKSNLQDLKIGDRVNLERALTLASRLGGHLVTGHVDGMGEIKNLTKSGNDLELQVAIPSDLLNYLVPKGSIAIDGVSLTVVDLRDGLVSVAVIPHSAKNTTIGAKRAGDRVNVEVDLLAKYVEKQLRGEPFKGLSEETLSRIGFMPMGWIDN